MPKPICVVLSDVHYDLPNLKLADAATRMAIAKANSLNVPLIVAGDLHNTKANLRGECVNAMLETFSLCEHRPYIIVGNHDKINEKSEDHSLNFLSSTATIIEGIGAYPELGLGMIAYQSSREDFKKMLSYMNPTLKTLIVHQGLKSSNSGDYTQDKSAISKDDVSGFRVISGHYHNRQTISLPNGGSWDYIGNPYTLTYGEANDPPKGFQILMGDGTLDFITCNLRSHRVWNMDTTLGGNFESHDGDLLQIKITGTHEELSNITRARVQKATGIEHFRLDLIPLDTTTKIIEKPRGNSELLDGLIDSLSNTSESKKARLKELWRALE